MSDPTAPPPLAVPGRTAHRRVTVDGVDVFYRESLPESPDAPVLLLLHGFPSGSHQFRRLIDALGRRYRLIAPDYPGFGRTREPEGFVHTFDRLAEIVDGFTAALGLERYALYMFDFGAPVGFRHALRRPERITGLVVQNGNAYEEGLSEGARDFIALTPDTPGADETVLGLITEEGIRGQYETGVAAPELVDPDGPLLDGTLLAGRERAQLALAYDYRSNVAAYPSWQAWLREHRPPLLITWGAGDPFFPEPGARAYLRDVPGAELHLFDTGHFALEDHLAAIAPLVADFLDRLPR